MVILKTYMYVAAELHMTSIWPRNHTEDTEKNERIFREFRVLPWRFILIRAWRSAMRIKQYVFSPYGISLQSLRLCGEHGVEKL